MFRTTDVFMLIAPCVVIPDSITDCLNTHRQVISQLITFITQHLA
ncbi:hypothetical protein [Providencia rettgeri]